MRIIFFSIFFGMGIWMNCWADVKIIPHQSTDTLVVGVTEAPPFIIRKANGQYDGICIDLWEHIAKRLSISFRYQEYELVGLVAALSNREVDLSIAPLTVTSHRIQDMQFSMPFFCSRLAIATRLSSTQTSLFSLLRNLFSMTFLKAIILLWFVLLIAGFLIWLIEHHTHDNHFGNGIKGVGQGIWWSAVTMTTVGYGDIRLKTGFGKFIAIIWMFMSLIIISSFTASITSLLTLNQMQDQIKELSDLHTEQVGVLLGSSSEEYLEHHHIRYQTYTSEMEGLKAIMNNKLDGFVYDEPILRYLIERYNLGDWVAVAPQSFNVSYYSFAVPNRSQLLYDINPILVELITDIAWEDKLQRYNVLQ